MQSAVIQVIFEWYVLNFGVYSRLEGATEEGFVKKKKWGGIIISSRVSHVYIWIWQRCVIFPTTSQNRCATVHMCHIKSGWRRHCTRCMRQRGPGTPLWAQPALLSSRGGIECRQYGEQEGSLKTCFHPLRKSAYIRTYTHAHNICMYMHAFLQNLERSYELKAWLGPGDPIHGNCAGYKIVRQTLTRKYRNKLDEYHFYCVYVAYYKDSTKWEKKTWTSICNSVQSITHGNRWKHVKGSKQQWQTHVGKIGV